MIIILNNKCNFSYNEFINYQEELRSIEEDNRLVLCPPNIYLSAFNLENFDLGCQNVDKNTCGPYTGNISASQLRSLNVKYTIVNHSERRKYCNENLLDTAIKIKELMENDIIPILCIGETLEERKQNKTESIIVTQLSEVSRQLTPEEMKKIIIAYEPIWAIGTGIIPSPEEVEKVSQLINKYLPNNKIIYGGSVDEKNIENFKQIKLLDGFLLGGLSLYPERLKKFLIKIEKDK